MSTTTTKFICRAHAKTTGKQCRNIVDGDLCRVHKSAVCIYPVQPADQQVQAPAASKVAKPAEQVTAGGELYKGHPVFSIRQGESFINFGKPKAEVILDNIEAIRRFVETGVIIESDNVKLSPLNNHGPILELRKGGKYVFSAGTSKFQKIIDHLSALQVWYAQQSN